MAHTEGQRGRHAARERARIADWTDRVRLEVTMTGVTVEITAEPREHTGLRHATIQLYDGDTPIPGATIDRPLPAPAATRARVGDRWTIALQREVTL